MFRKKKGRKVERNTQKDYILSDEDWKTKSGRKNTPSAGRGRS